MSPWRGCRLPRYFRLLYYSVVAGDAVVTGVFASLAILSPSPIHYALAAIALASMALATLYSLRGLRSREALASALRKACSSYHEPRWGLRMLCSDGYYLCVDSITGKRYVYWGSRRGGRRENPYSPSDFGCVKMLEGRVVQDSGHFFSFRGVFLAYTGPSELSLMRGFVLVTG